MKFCFYKWDPIGVSDSAWTREEYRAYLPKVFSYAMEGEFPDSIAEYLESVATKSMSLSPMPSKDQKVARLIVDIKNNLGL